MDHLSSHLSSDQDDEDEADVEDSDNDFKTLNEEHCRVKKIQGPQTVSSNGLENLQRDPSKKKRKILLQ